MEFGILGPALVVIIFHSLLSHILFLFIRVETLQNVVNTSGIEFV